MPFSPVLRAKSSPKPAGEYAVEAIGDVMDEGEIEKVTMVVDPSPPENPKKCKKSPRIVKKKKKNASQALKQLPSTVEVFKLAGCSDSGLAPREAPASAIADLLPSKGHKKRGAKRKAPPLPSEVVNESKKLQGSDGKTIVPSALKLGVEAYRKLHQIIVAGACPVPFETFDAAETELGGDLKASLLKQGYKAPTPIQAQAWPILFRGHDMVAVAETGSGKTCGFLLPALARIRLENLRLLAISSRLKTASKEGEPALPQALVLAPTRELAQQISGEADKFAAVVRARVVAVYGGVPKGDQIRQLEAGADVIVATPGRLLDFMTGRPERDLGPMVSLKRVTYLVLDEADRMLDMGFEPEIRKIVAKCPPSKGTAAESDANLTRQTSFFTATWPKEVECTAASLTSPGALQVRIGQGAGGDKLTANTNVKQVVFVMDDKGKLPKLKEILEKELARGETCIVFTKTRATCDYLEQKLWDEKEDLSIGTWCRAIHSHRAQWERDESLATFRSITTGKDNGRRGILVATDVAARGLDIPGVALVIVYDFGGGSVGQDSDVESYVHRIGRTGRAGSIGKAFTFFTENDYGAAKLVELLEGAKQNVPSHLRALAMADSIKGGKGRNGKGGKHGKGGGYGGKGGKGGKGSSGKATRGKW